MKRASAPRHAMTGLSLVELMVAMVISLILMFAVVQVFMASQAASRLSEGASRVQENARFALDFIERDVRMAGHMGCVNDQAHAVKNMGDPLSHLGVDIGGGSPLDFRVSIQGYEAPDTAPEDTLTLGETWAAPGDLPAALAGLAPVPAGGSDILVLRYLSAEGAPVNAITPTGGSTTLEGAASRMARLSGGGVAEPTLFGIADCGHVDLFAGLLSGSEVLAPGVDLTRYTTQPTGQTMLYRAESLVYYVAVSGETGLRGLRRARADASGLYVSNEEVVEGVESMQLMYGLDATPTISTDTPPVGNVNQVEIASNVSTGTDAAAANEWLRVGMVKVGLLVASPQPSSSVAPETPPAVLGVQFEPGARADGRYRGTYEVSIALRNRLFGN